MGRHKLLRRCAARERARSRVQAGGGERALTRVGGRAGAEDDGDCDGLPKDCNPECAGTFMPFFSRCGKTVFGADKDQVRAPRPARRWRTC
jgi:hypothetical protein